MLCVYRSTTKATSLDKKSSHGVREESIYYPSCHPQTRFVSSSDALLVGNFPCAVMVASHNEGSHGAGDCVLPRIVP